MSARRVLLVHNGPDTLDVAAALGNQDIDAITVEGFGGHQDNGEEGMSGLLDAAGTFDCLILAPIASEELDQPDAVTKVLTRSFSLMKAALASWGPGADGRISVMLPGEAAMGEPASPNASAVAGAMLSLSRTVALETRKGRSTVNTIMYGPALAAHSLGCFEAVAVQVVALLRPASRGINGQEIFATGAVDVGRLHP